MSSPARQSNSSETRVAPFRGGSDVPFLSEAPVIRTSSGLTAFSLEFVAKPEEAANAVRFLPAAIQSGLDDLPGFAGSLVMVSDLEARLITVVVFWEGSNVRRNCDRYVHRVRALLAPYLDRCLRAQNMLAHLPAQQNPQDSQPSSIDTCFINEQRVAQEANVCVA